MLKILLILFTLLFVTIPAIAIDTDKWVLEAHQEIAPHQSFPVGDYSITLAEREKNGLDDYTVIVYIEKNGNRQTELMRADDTAFFDDDHYQLEYDGTRNDRQIFNVYHEKSYPYDNVGGLPKNVSETVTSESINTSTQSGPTIPFDNSNLLEMGMLILLVGFRKR